VDARLAQVEAQLRQNAYPNTSPLRPLTPPPSGKGRLNSFRKTRFLMFVAQTSGVRHGIEEGVAGTGPFSGPPRLEVAAFPCWMTLHPPLPTWPRNLLARPLVRPSPPSPEVPLRLTAPYPRS